MTRFHAGLLVVNIAILLGFGWLFLQRGNLEFVIYVGVTLGFITLIGLSLAKVPYTPAALVGLTVWSAMHMAGGGIPVGDGRLYDVMVLPLKSRLPILRYDQIVHAWGFAAATLVVFCLVRSFAGERLRSTIALGIVTVAGGMGIGAFNEVVEFLVTLLVPNTGVGDGTNTSLDLCANMLGALGAWVYIRVRYLRAGPTLADGIATDIRG